MVYLVVLIILYIEGGVAIACDWQCPSDKPYCSEVGCVFECPEPFYINGSTCVSDCGDRFVDENRRCVASCENNTFAKETLKQVVSVQYLEKMCISCNQSDQYVFNGSCVKVCPESARYIDKNMCVSQCPVDRLFKTNITIYGLIHSKCIAKCPWVNVEDDNFCRDSCPDNKVQFKSSCVEKCPSSSPFISGRRCVTKCPYYAVSIGYENRTCIEGECPKSRPFVVNDTCVDKCPLTDPVIYFERTVFGYLRSYCVNTCDDGKYSFNNSCVYICPPNTVAVNNSCLKHCPSNTSYTCTIEKGYQCGERRLFRVFFDHAICVNTCPRNMLTLNQSCVYTCPYGHALFENDCTDTCPSFRPYIRNNTNGKDCNGASSCREIEAVLTCTQTCPDGSYILNNTCLSYCPYPLLHKGNTCVPTCPDSTPFIQNSTIDVEGWYYDSRYQYQYTPYQKRSQRKIIQKCVDFCSSGMLISNQTCVNMCPDNHPYIHNRTCLRQECETEYSAKGSSGIICTDKCKPQQFIHNRTCVGMCPTTNVLFNGTCVDHCPESHLLISRFFVGETCDKACTAQNVMQQCVKNCPDGLFEHENTCVEFCHKPMYTIDNKCVESCPGDRSYTVAASIVVANWKKDGNQFKKIKTNKEILKCEATCPPDKVLFRSQCSDRCPLNSWFITNGTCQSNKCKTNYKFSTQAGIWCFDECPQDLFAHNETCYLQCPDNLYAFGQNCINDCPSTHEIINNETIIANSYNCSWSSDYLCTDSLRYVKQCRNECPRNKFLHNSKCLDVCLKHTFMFDNSCVTKCPQSHPFAQPSLINIEKWREWSDGTGSLSSEEHLVNKCTVKCADEYPLRFGNTCYKHCPEAAPYLDNNTCVEKCPGDKLVDILTKHCVDECANDRGLFNFSCHYNCPERNKYIFNSHCVSACPSSHPVAIKQNRFICQKSCGEDKLFKDGECVFRYKCDDPMFGYEGLCLSRCPDGFVWVNNCRATLGAKIAIAVLVVVLLILIGFSRHCIWDHLHVLKLIYDTEEELKQIHTQQLRLSPKRKDEPEDEIPLRETFFHTGNEETYQMEVHAETTDNALDIDNTRL